MRILILMSRASPWSHSIASSLVDYGNEVHVFDYATPPSGSMPIAEGDLDEFAGRYASVRSTAPRFRGNLRHLAALPEFRRVARAVAPDITLCLYAGGFAWLCYFAGVRPYAVYAVGSDILVGGALKGALSRVTITAAAIVLANGEYLAERTRILAPRANVRSLLLGVNLEELRIGAKSGTVRIFNHRAFDRVYNNETIIRALSQLPDHLDGYEVVFASGGPGLEPAIELADELLAPSIRRRVVFWGGARPRRELLDYLSRTDVYVSMALSDGTSTSVLEAMACGAFPVLSDIPQNRPLVDAGRSNGLLVPPLDSARLSRALAECIAQPDGARSTAPINRSLVEAIANGDVNRRTLDGLLRESATPAGRSGQPHARNG